MRRRQLLVGDDKIPVRTTTMQRLVRDGRSMILPVLLRAHATDRLLKNRIFFFFCNRYTIIKIFMAPKRVHRAGRVAKGVLCCLPEDRPVLISPHPRHLLALFSDFRHRLHRGILFLWVGSRANGETKKKNGIDSIV